MKSRVLLLLSVLLVIISSSPSLADWDIAKNVNQRSAISLRGYMDEIFIYQTEKDFAGSKLVYGTQGSGTATRTMTTHVDQGEMHINVQGEFYYHPYRPITSENDLRGALRAKNLELGKIISESYSGMEYQIEETSSSNDGVPVYEISSQGRGTARLGAW